MYIQITPKKRDFWSDFTNRWSLKQGSSVKTFWSSLPGPILESKDMGVIFQKKGKEMLKKCKIFENLGRNGLNLKIFWKRAGDGS